LDCFDGNVLALMDADLDIIPWLMKMSLSSSSSWGTFVVESGSGGGNVAFASASADSAILSGDDDDGVVGHADCILSTAEAARSRVPVCSVFLM
jgi:hypothetical protein